MKFNIVTTEGLKEVDGEPIDILGHKCFIHTGEELFIFITERSTGMSVCFDNCKESAIDKAKQLFQSHSEIEWKKKAQGNLRYAGISYPVNL